MKILITYSLLSLLLGRASGFVPSHATTARYQKSEIVYSSSSRQEDLFDAEEAAAVDAHNAPDPGVEAAASERAVMIADDMVDRGKLQSKLTKEEQEDSGTDSTDINPMKVLYRAFKMAYDMMSQKRETLRTNVKKAKDVETEYMTMKRTADQLVQVLKSYQADPSAFKHDFATKGKDESAMAVEVLEMLIAYEADDILELERDETYAVASFLDALQKEDISEARYAFAKAKERSASERMNQIEEFDGDYEVDERKRDMAEMHVNKEAEKVYKRKKSVAVRRENEYLTQEFDMNKKLDELKSHEKTLKADLEEVKEIVRAQLRAEWEEQKASKTESSDGSW